MKQQPNHAGTERKATSTHYSVENVRWEFHVHPRGLLQLFKCIHGSGEAAAIDMITSNSHRKEWSTDLKTMCKTNLCKTWD